MNDAELTSSTRSSSRSRSRSPSSSRSRSRSPPSPSSLRSIWTKFHQLQRGEWLLQRLCGSATRATVIWEVGLPNTFRIPFRWVSILTENEDTTDAILNWLSRLGDSIQEHKATLFYQEHTRKSGTEKKLRPPMEDMNAAWKQIGTVTNGRRLHSDNGTVTQGWQKH